VHNHLFDFETRTANNKVAKMVADMVLK